MQNFDVDGLISEINRQSVDADVKRVLAMRAKIVQSFGSKSKNKIMEPNNNMLSMYNQGFGGGTKV